MRKNGQKKKIPWLLLVVVVIFLFAGKNDKDDVKSLTSTEKTNADAVVLVTPKPTTATTKKPTAKPTEFIDNSEKYPRKLEFKEANIPECWLLYESEYSIGDTTPKIYEIYSAINPQKDGWQNEVKIVLSMFYHTYNEYDDVLIRVYNSMDNENHNQPTFTNLIAFWQSKPVSFIEEKSAEITWYVGAYSTQNKTEEWHP